MKGTHVKTKILDFLKRTQKATGALVGALSVLGAATFLPAAVATYVGLGCVIGTWLLAYVFPYVQKAVETFPLEDVADEFGVELDDDPEPIEGEIIEPITEEIPIPRSDTTGIPVVEGESAPDYRPAGPTVEEIITRLRSEGTTV